MGITWIVAAPQLRLDTRFPVCPLPLGAQGRSVLTFPYLPQVTLLIAFICVRSSFPIDYGAHSFFEVVTMCDLIMILVFYLVHLFRLYRVLTCISWPLSVRGRPGPAAGMRELGRGHSFLRLPVPHLPAVSAALPLTLQCLLDTSACLLRVSQTPLPLSEALGSSQRLSAVSGA